MPRETNVYDLLISCPGDISTELDLITKVVDEFNRYHGSSNNTFIQTRHWSKDSYPQSGGKAQELLNYQFIDSCDAAIALFWTRFGRPTDKYLSGTEEEIDRMVKSGKQVFLYFCDKPISISTVDFKQYNKVTDFKQKYKNEGMYYIYKSDEEFEKFLSNHLYLYFIKSKSRNTNLISANSRFSNIIKNKITFDILEDYTEYHDIKTIVSYGTQRDISIIKNDNGFDVNINILNCNSFGNQEFIMALLEYNPYENWGDFYKGNYAIEFDLNSTEGINAVQLEIKDDNQGKIVDKKIYISKNLTHQKLELNKLTRYGNAWKKIRELCFTVFINDDYISVMSGKLSISNLHLVPQK